MATPDVITKLAGTLATADHHIVAATELLIEHDYWLRRPDFVEACVYETESGVDAYIQWSKARTFHDGDLVAASSQRAVLDAAVLIGQDTLRFTSMGHVHSDMLARAFSHAITRKRPGTA